MDIRKIALYLSGKTPPEYKPQNRGRFIQCLFDNYKSDFDESRIDFRWNQANKSDEDFYNMILDILYKKTLADPTGNENTKFQGFLKNLGVVELISGISQDTNGKDSNKSFLNLVTLDKFLKSASETDFARELILPLMNEMGFKDITYYGPVHEKDYGIDMYPITMSSPFGDHVTLGIQFKKGNLGNGSRNPGWQDLKSEINDAFSKNGQHISISGDKLKLDGIIVITSGNKGSLNFDSDLHDAYKDKFVRGYSYENVIQWCKTYQLPSNVIESIEMYEPKKPSPRKVKRKVSKRK